MIKTIRYKYRIGNKFLETDIPILTNIHDQLSAIDPKFLNEDEVLKAVNDGIRLFIGFRIRKLMINKYANKSINPPWWNYYPEVP